MSPSVLLTCLVISSYAFPSRAVTALAWKPSREGQTADLELAVVSEDSSLRVYSLNLE